MSLAVNKNWASARAYAEAIQAPAVCFRDPQLRQTEPAFDRLGMPLVTSGQFAYVFKLKQSNGAPPFAVRCFRGDAPDREERYRHIAAHLAAHHVPAIGAFKFDPDGILVGGQTFPILLMEWIEGHTLDVYLEETAGNRAVMQHLAGEWLRLLRTLKQAGVAHGDLQHGNIIVQRGNLRLIDLDGMFVPSLAGMTAGEVGHQHYQHPRRDETIFDERLDRFSALVIYLSLVALGERPALWAEHHDENLIFTKEDFLDPASSPLFAKIKEISGEARRLAEMLEAAAMSDPRDVPDVLDKVEPEHPAFEEDARRSDMRRSNAPKSKLPAWMRETQDEADEQDAWLAVARRTREAVRVDVPKSVQVKDYTSVTARTQQQGKGMHNTPTTPASQHVQSLFSSSTPQTATAIDPYPAPLDPSQLVPATFHYAKHAARQGIAFIWMLIWVGTGFFKLLGASSALAWLLAAITFIIPCLAYGFHRAYKKLPRHYQNRLVSQNLKTLNLSFGSATTGALSALHNNSGQVIVASSTQSIYHLESCPWAQRIATRNRIAFSSITEAQAAGYYRCKVCLP